MTGQLLFLASRPDRGLRAFLVVAQRRPGPRPRRHYLDASSLNEGRGRDPGDTLIAAVVAFGRSTLNEGRGRDPGDTPAARDRDHGRPRPSLNEGRGRDPGDTSVRPTAPYGSRGTSGTLRSTKAGAETPATPGKSASRAFKPPFARSTKAGAETPATPVDDQLHRQPWRSNAQRRPGPRPRRHENHPHQTALAVARSTKAGAETPATHGRGIDDVGEATPPRSTKAGAETPATLPVCPLDTSLRMRPLNEGRGRDPGDTGHDLRTVPLRQGERSTKAGAETPATRVGDGHSSTRHRPAL